MRLRFLHLADVHLGCKNFYLAEKARQRTEEFRLAFREGIEFALDPANEIDGVLLAGNLFEYHRPDEELWSFSRGLISRLLAKGTLVAMVPGHYDSYAYKNSVYRTERLPGVELFLNTAPEAPRVHEIRGRRVFLYGMTYVPGQTPSPLPPFTRVQDKGIHIALLNGQPGPTDGAPSPHVFVPDRLALGKAGFDYVALGGHRTFHEEVIGQTTLVYPGSLEGRGFEESELGDKGWVVAEFDDSGVHVERFVRNRRSIECVALDLREECITDAEALKEALSALSGKDRITRVTLTGTAEFVASLEDIQDELADKFFHLELIDESGLVDSALLRKIESENTIRGYFVRKLARRIEDIKAKIVKKGQTDALLHELAIHEKAMKMGVEQFVEEETPADSIYSLIPDSDETVDATTLKESIGVTDLEEKIKAMLEHRRKKNGDLSPIHSESGAGSNGARQTPVEGAREQEGEQS